MMHGSGSSRRRTTGGSIPVWFAWLNGKKPGRGVWINVKSSATARPLCLVLWVVLG